MALFVVHGMGRQLEEGGNYLKHGMISHTTFFIAYIVTNMRQLVTTIMHERFETDEKLVEIIPIGTKDAYPPSSSPRMACSLA